MAKETFIERKEYNNVITIKLVFPTICNYDCVFCYNKDKEQSKASKLEFLVNFMDSLNKLILTIGKQNPISLDITGGEPTMNVVLFIDVMRQLREYRIQEKVCRVTLTTNGLHLKECARYMDDVVNYVNISVHDFDMERRRQIVQTNRTLFTDEDYRDVVDDLRDHGITASATAVIHKEIADFSQWRDQFIAWAKVQGFIALRFRCDVFWESDCFDRYLKETLMDEQFQVLVHEETPDSHWCRLRMADKFRVFFLHGVLDTSLHTKGIEYIIDTDGKCYCDYYRRTPIEDYVYPIGRIFDKKQE